ncbi:MAG: S41 family peptidase [Oscillospiraceae bacterium]|nr:S41 family peptidase [Oscillospiraceae bacterium]
MKKRLTTNKAFNNFAKFAVCALLCLMLGAQSFVFGYGEITEPIWEIEPTIDELLDIYLEISLYDLTREEAIVVMLRNFLINNPDMVPYFGNALLTAFDPYGGYYPETTSGELFSGLYHGFGIVLDGKRVVNGIKYHAVVNRVFDESPAAEAGIRGGDEIMAINGVNFESFGVNAVSHFLAVCPDEVNMTVKRGEETLTFTMHRDVVFVQSVSFYPDELTKTALIKIDDFLDEYMFYDIYQILEFLEENEYENIIIDLRGNPGGYIGNMLESLNMFVVGEGIVLYNETDKNGQTESLKSSGHGAAFDKICILVDGDTASAAELFALSMREVSGAVIIGEKTFGKGIGQSLEALSNGDLAAITAIEVFSAHNTAYHGIGIEPDIKISPVYVKSEKKAFGQLNFVNCRQIKANADNDAVLALNQRLCAIGYILPEDVSSKCTGKTVTAVEIFQRYNDLPVGITKIDYTFIEYLNFFADYYFTDKYEENDAGLECAEIYIEKGEKAAKEFAKASAK